MGIYTTWSFMATGIWFESVITSVKKCLEISFGKQELSIIEFHTVFIEAAKLLNERPTGRNSTQPDDVFNLFSVREKF